MNLGIAIKEIRRQKGLSQAELAERAQTTQASLSQIEAGRRPSTETLKNISESLGVPEAVLYIAAMEDSDVPVQNKVLYDQLFPVVKSMLMKIVGAEK